MQHINVTRPLKTRSTVGDANVHLHDPLSTLALVYSALPGVLRHTHLPQFLEYLCVDLVVLIAGLWSLHAMLRRHPAGHHERVLVHGRACAAV